MRALALALLVALVAPRARANDCFRDESAGEVRCSLDGFDRLVAELGDVEDERDFCRKDLKQRTEERDAARDHARQLDEAPPPPPPPSDFWPGFEWGAGTAGALFLLGLLFAR